METLLTISELAEILRTTPRGIRLRRHRRQSLPPALRLGGKLLWRERDVTAWLEAEALRQGIEGAAPAAQTDCTESRQPRRSGRPRKNIGAG
ncbi:MAG: helix-turn-helix domain-containing protein [Candidatus Cloacimonetes bacterium]|nr:helix-turn-helix domain-containing protein [Candidatus Cloacimonadota bacterium]MDY0368056.1 helix-turn-helix domain-containing protein [Candidatus Syntrophosphaera sp.]